MKMIEDFEKLYIWTTAQKWWWPILVVGVLGGYHVGFQRHPQYVPDGEEYPNGNTLPVCVPIDIDSAKPGHPIRSHGPTCWSFDCEAGVIRMDGEISPEEMIKNTAEEAAARAAAEAAKEAESADSDSGEKE